MEAVDDGRVVHAWIELNGVEPSEAIRAFTDPALLREWWGGELELDPVPGGDYVVRFESQGWTLNGKVLSYDPESKLTFTWTWEHHSDAPLRGVKVRAQPAEGGTRLEIEHGPHGGSEAEKEEADSHREGWLHFLPRIAALLSR